jgi:cobalt-zinc-cadmium efflux system outer membrane protein
MDLANAELALRRARNDLATRVRTVYFALLVARESVRVNRTLAHFTDEVFRIQVDLLGSGFAASYEPAALRAQAFTARLAFQQSIVTYFLAWKQLVATIGLRPCDVPLTVVAGRVDLLIPCYNYDAVLARVLDQHTDILTARNTIERARLNLKLAQRVPFSDIDVRGMVQKDYAGFTNLLVHSLQVGVNLPIWDQNQGNIIAAEAALVRATEEPHRVEVTLTGNLTTAFTAYRNNLQALQEYRTRILPDQVRNYRGVYERRGADPNVVFNDVVTSQQTLVSGITTYLTLLGQLWTSVVNVADLLQTDDLFQLAHPEQVAPLPDLEHLLPLLCQHPCSPLSKAPPEHCAPPGPAVVSPNVTHP